VCVTGWHHTLEQLRKTPRREAETILMSSEHQPAVPRFVQRLPFSPALDDGRSIR